MNEEYDSWHISNRIWIGDQCRSKNHDYYFVHSCAALNCALKYQLLTMCRHCVHSNFWVPLLEIGPSPLVNHLGFKKDNQFSFANTSLSIYRLTIYTVVCWIVTVVQNMISWQQLYCTFSHPYWMLKMIMRVWLTRLPIKHGPLH